MPKKIGHQNVYNLWMSFFFSGSFLLLLSLPLPRLGFHSRSVSLSSGGFQDGYLLSGEVLSFLLRSSEAGTDFPRMITLQYRQDDDYDNNNRNANSNNDNELW